MVIYRQLSTIDHDKFVDFLCRIDTTFTPHLSEKTDIISFSKKILTLGNVIAAIDELTSESLVVGAICFYDNDKSNFRGYISMIGVDKRYSGKHIATQLINEAVKKIVESGMISIGIHTNNPVAYHIYIKAGFNLVSKDNSIPVRYYFEFSPNNQISKR